VTSVPGSSQQVPTCCDEPMVSYCGDWAWECADAYFALLDDGVLYEDGASPPNLRDDATDEQRQLYEHLLATRIDGGSYA
jgi:hypothetical protein